MPLLRATFDCEVLTPMFVSGVDQRSCELRPASLRGALRFWYRALLGGRGVTDLGELKRQEAAVFGSTDAASPVRVRVVPPDDLARHTKHPRALPEWDGKQLSQNSGMGYLWFSVTLGSNERSYIEPGTRFAVTLSVVASGTQAHARREALAEAVRAFWLLAHLGGLGTRARRGAGSFWVRSVRSSNGLDLPPFPAALDADVFRRTVASWNLREGAERPPFAALAPRFCRIVLEPGVRRWEELVNEVGADYKEYRSTQGKEGRSDAERASFGLPLTVGRGQSARQILLTNSERRGSPLHIRIVPSPSGGYDTVYTHFDSRFAAAGEDLLIKGAAGRVAPAEPGLVPDFLDSIPTSTLLLS